MPGDSFCYELLQVFVEMRHIGVEITGLFLWEELLTIEAVQCLGVQIPSASIDYGLLLVLSDLDLRLEFGVHFPFDQSFMKKLLPVWLLLVFLFLLHLQKTGLEHAT